MAAAQADVVHEGLAYDLGVDTSHTESLECARTIAARVRNGEAAPDPLCSARR